MRHWLKFIFVAALIGFAKGHHFIRLVILAGLGLAGLWMVHMLAQDVNRIQSSGGETKIFKRSIEDNRDHQINWESILSKDPAGCARSFLCQLVATDQIYLSNEELIMLELSRTTLNKESWASKQLEEAISNGEKVKQPSQCMKIYKYCPYTSKMMLTLLRMFGS